MNGLIRGECRKCKTEADPFLIENGHPNLPSLIGSLYTGGPCKKCKYDIFKVKSVNMLENKSVKFTVIKP